jgi:hypothetical protein
MKKISLEKLSHYSIILISISALFVSIWQINLSQNHNKLSVKPYLDYHLGQGDSILLVTISNSGFGPAIIKKTTYTYKGDKYYSLEKLLNDSDEIKNRITSNQYPKNSIIPAEKTKLLVKLKGMQLRGIHVKIEYETIYKEKEIFEFEF